MYNNYCTNNNWIWLWPFGFFIFLVLFFIISRFFKWSSHYRQYGHWQDHEHHDPMQIAKVRYAAGKISKEELDIIKKELDK